MASFTCKCYKRKAKERKEPGRKEEESATNKTESVAGATKRKRMDWDLVEAGALTPLGDNRQLAFLRDAAHEEEDVDVPVS